MPELPEVETIAATLYPHVAASIFTHATLLRQSSLHPLSLPLDSLVDTRINTVGRRGKLLLFKLERHKKSQPTLLVAHLRMTGRLFTRPALTEPGKHTRCIFQLLTAKGATQQLFFDDTRAFGQLMAATPETLEQWPFWHELGPEPLEMNDADLAARLKGSRPLKTALMDQKVIAGIGNIYADESLFRAGLLPMREAGSLNTAETKTLITAIQDILRLSISQCGSSIRDYRDANGKEGEFQKGFKVYGRGGEKCEKCGAPLQKIRLSGRATVFCQNCQK